jgi:hypothetical protein
MRRAEIAIFAVAALGAIPAAVRAQEGTGAPRVFFDCRSPQCDNTYYRTEIDWVSWVRDQADADVYVIMTSQETGGGGREYLIDLLGRGAQAAFSLDTRYRALATDTERERLDGVALTLGRRWRNTEGRFHGNGTGIRPT